jgi:signal transduction histidine kinase
LCRSPGHTHPGTLGDRIRVVDRTGGRGDAPTMGAPIEFEDPFISDDRGVLPDVRMLAETLHDGLSQQLFAAELDLHELRLRNDLPDEVRVVLDRLGDRLTLGSRQLREALLSVLVAEDGEVRSAPLPEALRELSDGFAAGRPEVAISVQVIGDGPEPAEPACRVLLRAVREGLANVAKHAGAHHVLVVLRRGRRWWTVEVHDDGCGDPARLQAGAVQLNSFGLYSLMGDAARVGGRLTLVASPELSGVLLAVTVPVSPPVTRG